MGKNMTLYKNVDDGKSTIDPSRAFLKLNSIQKEALLKYSKFFNAFEKKLIPKEYFFLFCNQDDFQTNFGLSTSMVVRSTNLSFCIVPNIPQCLSDENICNIEFLYEDIMNLECMNIHLKINKRYHTLNRVDSKRLLEIISFR